MTNSLFPDLDRKIEMEDRVTNFLTELYGDAFIGRFSGHIVASFPFTGTLSEAISIYSRQIKAHYRRYVEFLGWDRDEFKTIVWNIALETAYKPFSSKTYEIYKIKYINNELEVPPGVQKNQTKEEEDEEFWEI